MKLILRGGDQLGIPKVASLSVALAKGLELCAKTPNLVPEANVRIESETKLSGNNETSLGLLVTREKMKKLKKKRFTELTETSIKEKI